MNLKIVIIFELYIQMTSHMKNILILTLHFLIVLSAYDKTYCRHFMLSLFIDDLEMFLLEDINLGLTIEDITIILLLLTNDMVIIDKIPSESQISLEL